MPITPLIMKDLKPNMKIDEVFEVWDKQGKSEKAVFFYLLVEIRDALNRIEKKLAGAKNG